MPRLLTLLFILLALPVHAQTRITFGTDWLAEAEHGGFYQALATGLYRRHGLDVTIRMGGPQGNTVQQIAAGQVDFQITSGSFGALNLVEQNIPVLAVAAFFQKDPQVLIAHPGEGHDTLASLKGKPIMISGAARFGYWLFLKAKFGFTDAQIRPYNFSMAPFLVDRSAVQQGYVSSEPFQIERISGEKPVVMLLADAGYSSYANIILAQAAMVRDHPGTVRNFIEASIEGWNSYLRDDPTPGNELIRKDNKDMTPETLDFARRMIRDYGIADSGDTKTLGLGAMTDARWQQFFEFARDNGVYKPGLDFHKAYTLEFVNHAHDLKPTP